MRLASLTLAASIAASLISLADDAAAQVRRPLPAVERLEPTSGPPGTEVTVHGRHFDPQQTVWLGGAALEVVSRLPNRWVVRIGDATTSGVLEVRTDRGAVRGPRFRVTAAAPPPTITGLAPDHGPAGAEVVIRGTSFSPRPTENQVHLGERPVVVHRANPTELRVIVPADAATAPFRVRVIGAGEASSAPFTVEAGTAVTAFEPALGPPGTRVTIRGTGFDRRRGRTRVRLGEQTARVIRASETELTVEVPRRGAASGLWLVEVRDGGRAYSAARFDVRYPPRIDAITPTFGAPGTRVTLRGEHFGTDIRDVRATIGETALRPRDIADDRLVVEVPAGASEGPIELTIEGLAPARSRERFRPTAAVALTDFAPRSGPAGTEVTLTGTGFSTVAAQNHVMLGAAPAEIVRASATQLVVRVPEAPSGPLVVTVDNAGEARTPHPFVMTHPPRIEAFAPTTAAPGAALTIRGAGFGTRRGLVRVSLNGLDVPVTSVGDTQITATLPRGARTGRLQVTVRLHGSATAAEELTVTE